MKYYFEEVQHIQVEVYDRDSDAEELSKHVRCTLSIVRARCRNASYLQAPLYHFSKLYWGLVSNVLWRGVEPLVQGVFTIIATRVGRIEDYG